MSSIIGQIKPEHPELFALDLGKIAESDFVYTLASAPNLVKMYVTIRSQKFDYGLNRTRTVLVFCP